MEVDQLEHLLGVAEADHLDELVVLLLELHRAANELGGLELVAGEHPEVDSALLDVPDRGGDPFLQEVLDGADTSSLSPRKSIWRSIVGRARSLFSLLYSFWKAANSSPVRLRFANKRVRSPILAKSEDFSRISSSLKSFLRNLVMTSSAPLM